MDIQIVRRIASKLKMLIPSYMVCFSEGNLGLYRNFPRFSHKLRRQIPFKDIVAIYADSFEYYYFKLDVFLTDNTHLELYRPPYVWAVVNWQEFVDELPNNLKTFNLKNLDLADLAEDIPILCWHSQKTVENIEWVYDGPHCRLMWEKTDKEYDVDEYLELQKNSKRIM